MTWFKVDDHLHSHRKAMRAGTEAMGLWVLAGSWSGAEESDGWVPEYVLTRLAGPGADQLAARLAAAGLWDAGAKDGEEGFQFRGWDEFQPTKAQLETKREQARERMRVAREQSNGVRANTKGTSPAVTPTPTRPDPTRTNNITAAVAAEFESWWEGYPKKVAKIAAEKAYAKARKSATADELMAGLANSCAVWTAEATPAKYIPGPAVWLNQGRWADEQAALPGTDDSPAPRRTLAQCDAANRGECDTPHPWEDARNLYHCQGA